MLTGKTLKCLQQGFQKCLAIKNPNLRRLREAQTLGVPASSWLCIQLPDTGEQRDVPWQGNRGVIQGRKKVLLLYFSLFPHPPIGGVEQLCCEERPREPGPSSL